MSERKPTVEQLRRKLAQVDSYTDGWDIVVGEIKDELLSKIYDLERTVIDLESELTNVRKALRRARIAVP